MVSVSHKQSPLGAWKDCTSVEGSEGKPSERCRPTLTQPPLSLCSAGGQREGGPPPAPDGPLHTPRSPPRPSPCRPHPPSPHGVHTRGCVCCSVLLVRDECASVSVCCRCVCALCHTCVACTCRVAPVCVCVLSVCTCCVLCMCVYCCCCC